ncbi:MAG: hypothetical protein HKN72_16510 [Gemmatimonadetes bacterium]|nr:hypothetical protein [Gemmatimonadota bacterium]
MDSAVGLVQTYLRVNGYFTVVEYPVVESRGGFRAATDLDVLAFRFPGAGRLIPGERGQRGHPPFAADPLLGVPDGHPDMLIGEVKEGEARFNRSGRRAEVIAAALTRFGCCSAEGAGATAAELLQSGRASTDHDHRVRLVAFGSVLSGSRGPYQEIPLGHVLRYLESWVDEHWAVLRHTQLKDPVLSFLATLMKAKAGAEEAPPGDS